jgi:acetyl-CoA carboxylase carboxyltransferase component
MNDALRSGTGLLHGIPVALAVMEFGFMGGSMGSVVGEKLTRLIEYATQEGLTLLVVCTSGGARMQVRLGNLPCTVTVLHAADTEVKPCCCWCGCAAAARRRFFQLLGSSCFTLSKPGCW